MYYEEGKNISQISEETGRDRKTIRTYLNKYDWNETVKCKESMPYQKLDSFKTVIDEWLEKDKQAKRKQRHTAKRVFDRLSEIYGDEFNCSYRTVAGYVAEKKKTIYKMEEGYIPLEHIPGEAQADFGEAEFIENGTKYCGKYLNVSFPYSNQGYLQLFRGENLECLLEGLVAMFKHIGGVPTRLWFDNTKTIVTKILKGGGRNLTDKFLRFKEHYGFEAVFCNPDEGHEKGNVESKVGYHRRNLLVPIPEFQELRQFNVELLEKCDKDSLRDHYRKDSSISDLHEADIMALIPLPTTEFDTAKYKNVKTNGYGRFYLENGLHEYSVSPKYANCKVLVKVTAEEVIPLTESLREIVNHQRLYGKYKQQSMKWLPYLQQLSRRPAALKYSGIYKMFPKEMQLYLDKCTKQDTGKILQTIASLTENSGFDAAVDTVKTALCYNAMDVESLVNLHRKLHSNVIELPPMHIPGQVPKLDPVHTDFTGYDNALKGGSVE